MKKTSGSAKTGKKVVARKPEARVNNISSSDFAAYASFFENNALEELIIEEKGTKVVFRKNVPQQAVALPAFAPAPVLAPAAAAPAAPAPASAAAPAAAPADEAGLKVTSPLNGTFYASPSPDSPPFVSVGSMVSPGTVLCIVEAMKIFNEIKSEHAGKVSRILAKTGDAVKDGQTLFLIEPA